MPAKGSVYKTGKRDWVITKQLHKDFLKQHPTLNVDYKTFKEVILKSNELIRDFVANSEDGFKLPLGLGYLVVTRYKSKKKAIDWLNTKKLGKKVYLTNMHSLSYIHHIKWYKNNIVDFNNAYVYKIDPYRLLARQVAKNIKEGKRYHEWRSSDFWTNNKTKKLNL